MNLTITGHHLEVTPALRDYVTFSISALLEELVAAADREAIFRAEREATLAEAGNRAVREEDEDWAEAADDDID